MLRAVGQLDQFAKDTFAEETARVTHGAAAWQVPPELGLSEVRLDGLLVVHDPAPLAALAAPWSLSHGADEIVIEIKMPGDHLDMAAVDRAVLRRQARQVKRREDPQAPWEGEEPMWIVSPHLPVSLAEHRTLELAAPGCYRVGPSPFPFLWIAANDLPLADELVPFLIARSGRALDAFVRWVRPRRPLAWLLRVVRYLPMSTITLDDLRLPPFDDDEPDDPEMRARMAWVAEWALKGSPETREKLIQKGIEEGIEQGRLEEERSTLRRVLALRRLALSAEDEARIDACADLDTLRRWHDQAVVAVSAAEALR
jgi:hypothetical protein